MNSLTAHRFLIAAAAVAAKGLSDQFWKNKRYAFVGGITTGELYILEREILLRLDWKIVPDHDVLTRYYHGLVMRSQKYSLDSPNVQ